MNCADTLNSGLLLCGSRTRRRVLEAHTPPHAFNKSESIVEPVWSPQTQHYVRDVAVLTYRRLLGENGCSKMFSGIVRVFRLVMAGKPIMQRIVSEAW